MGFKLIIAQACAILAAGAASTEHCDVGETVEVDTKEEALSLARMGRAMFLDKAQDPTKGLLTATKEDLDSIKKQAAAIAADRKEREAALAAASPTGQAAALAAAVAAAMAPALQSIAAIAQAQANAPKAS